MKKCASCNIVQLKTNFKKDKQKKDGLCSYCRDCVKTKSRKYYEENKLTIHEKSKKYRAKNRDHILLQKRQHHHENKERLNAISRKYHHNNRDALLKKKTVYSMTNGGRYNYLKQKAKKYKQDMTIGFKDYCDLIKDDQCYYCGGSLQSRASFSLDRIDNKRGYHVDNVLACCKNCNLLRGNRLTVDETKYLIEKLMEYRNKTGIWN